MTAPGRPDERIEADDSSLRELVVCALDAWDEVWIRNQPLTHALLKRHPDLRVLYVEPGVDPLWDLSRRRIPGLPRLRSLRADGRLHALRPLKPLPRRLGSFSDRMLQRQVIGAARRLGFEKPTLWLNDVTYAPLIFRIGWPTVYELSDDWLLAPFPPREIVRLRALDGLAMAHAREVVVCSRGLAASRERRVRSRSCPTLSMSNISGGPSRDPRTCPRVRQLCTLAHSTQRDSTLTR